MMDELMAWTGLNTHSLGELKIWIVAHVGLARDALHIHIGLLIYFAVKLLWRGPRGTIAALLIVVGIASGGEIWDHLYERSIGKACDWPDHIKDMINTCLWPAVLAFIWQLRRKKG